MADLKFKEKIRAVGIAGLVMACGAILFKFIPAQIFGREILFDASLHLIIAIFALYTGWYFIDQNKSWRIPYFIISSMTIIIISIQRISVNAHNDIGLLAGLFISLFAIYISRLKYFRGRISF